MTIRLILVLIATCVSWTTARAASVPYQLSGVVSDVYGDITLASEFSVGEVINGQMTMALTPLLAEPTRAVYDVTAFTANIGGDYVITSNGAEFEIRDGSFDQIQLHIIPPIAPAVSGYSPDYFAIQLNYVGTSNLTSVNLIPEFVFSSPQDNTKLRFGLQNGGSVEFTLTQFSMVPEPSTIALALLSVPALFAVRRRLR